VARRAHVLNSGKSGYPIHRIITGGDEYLTTREKVESILQAKSTSYVVRDLKAAHEWATD
jgi:hypothetical protein